MHIWVKNDMCLFARLWVWLLALASLKEEQIPYSPWNLCNIKKKKILAKVEKEFSTKSEEKITFGLKV